LSRVAALREARRALAALACAASLAFAQAPTVAPPEALVLDGVPPIPASIAEALAPYGEFRPHALLSWHPTKREMLVRRRLHETNQVHRVAEPGATPEPLTDRDDPVGYASYSPADAKFFVFTSAAGGNEVYRLYRKDLASGEVSAISPAGERVVSVAWSRDGSRLAYAAQSVDRVGDHREATTTVHVVEMGRGLGQGRLRSPDRTLARLAGGGWFGLAFSEDAKQLAFVEYRSAADSRLWVIDAASGKKRRVTKSGAHRVAYGEPHFSPDARALFATSDRGSEFKRLVRITIASGAERVLTPKLAHDVEDLEVSVDARRIAFIDNEDGADVLRFLDLDTLKELPRPPLIPGVIGGLQWRRGSSEIGFQVASARTAGDVFSYDLATNRLTRWTNGNSPDLNTRGFVEPDTIRWKGFDGREIRGFYYRPPATFTGKRPVLISIHGGPESQARAGFIGRNNYLLNDLGIALIYPNVRGSAGFGKTFLTLDDGRKREDSVKDIGALLDWIAARPDLDAARVAVIGGSYGGYMALACAEKYADRIAAAESIVGITDFVTFLEGTQGYRRSLRRAEYGDERDPSMRAFLKSISPLTNVERIAKPLFIAQGANDPRVPASEAARIVASMKQRGKPVWYLLARDEGHGFARKANADFLFYATVEFLRESLLR
jgi:dipeptidyl aminopeptidase/acylaminoacyl peptidase